MKRILIIDDEANIRLMIRLSLKNAGYETDTASDGTEGLGKFGDGSAYDLVLLDHRMPDMTGLEVLREMRRRNSQARVIMITAFGTIDLATEAIEAGATDFLRKPFTNEVLRDAVRASLEHDVAPLASQSLKPSVSFLTASINGYRIEAEDSSDGSHQEAASALSQGHGFQQSFQVRVPAENAVRHCTVVLPEYFLELVKAHADVEKIPDAPLFWQWFCEEALANYLWQHAELPPNGLLQVDELTSSLRRWVEAVLVH